MKIYTIEQVAEILQVSDRTVYKLVNEGELRAKKVGNMFRISERALQEFMEDVSPAERDGIPVEATPDRLFAAEQLSQIVQEVLKRMKTP